ncbi:hypothetical protein RXV91_05815 [Lactiplantibacillus sp. DA1]|uniref:hypothetical protein n=1 Tax=Lactiplantibacillus sp. DA1 TaxID=3079857 RepID=UPI00292A5E6F|nr:hypothetical protein [Lactiplantibacillus sp. DA1]MDV0430390.1 hypothetical protein [Lactiplantibacillus sp. DA1]
MSALLIGLIIYHFLHEQFEFSKITRLGYWIIPIFTLYQFGRTFTWSPINGLVLMIIIGFATWIGHYQARHTKIRLEETATTFFRDSEQHEIPIYRKVITAQGGRPYLLGWLMTLGAQFIIEITYLHEHLSWTKINQEFFQEVLADLITFYRFSASGRHTSWTLWALTGGTSLAYTLWLAHRSPAAKQTLFGETMYHHTSSEHVD